MGLILTSPGGEEVTYALRFEFMTSNNEVEYKALLACLRLSKRMRADRVTALTDSRLTTNQVRGELEERDKRMENYMKANQRLVKPFKTFSIKQIPRSENRMADAFSQLASTCFVHLSKEVLVEVLKERSIEEDQVHALSPTQPNWMTLIVDYLQHDILPGNHIEARKIRIKASQYTMVEGMLYMKWFMTPWLGCVDETNGKKALQETHVGPTGAHERARALTRKILKMGIY